MAQTTISAFPSDSWFATYKIAGVFHFIPVAGFIALFDPSGAVKFVDLDIIPMVWDRVGTRFIDARTLPGFRALGRTKSIEPHYLATEEMLLAAIPETAVLSKADVQGLVVDQTVKRLASMIADKKVARVLTQGLADPIP